MIRRQFLKRAIAGGGALFLPRTGLFHPSELNAAIADISGQHFEHHTGSSVTSDTFPFPSSVTAGNLLVLAGATFDTVPIASLVASDDRGTSYTVYIGNDGTNISVFIAIGLAGSSGACNPVIDTMDNGSGPGETAFISWGGTELSGVHATPLDVDGGQTTGTGPVVSDDLTTVAANSYIIGVMAHSGGNIGLTPGYTEIAEQEDGASYQAFALQIRAATTATTYTMSWTAASSVSWIARTLSVKPTAVAAVVRRHRVIMQ